MCRLATGEAFPGDSVKRMRDTKEKKPAIPTRSTSADDPPTPTEVLTVALAWFRHYWKIPRPKSKKIEIATFWLNVILAVLALITAFIFYGQFEEMQAQRRLSIRPWVGIGDEGDALAISPITLDSDGNARIQYRIGMKNFGPSRLKTFGGMDG
jgi:hypothetical protein